MSEKTEARKTAEKIFDDILDRSKVNDAFEDIEPDIKETILDDWEEIIRNNHPVTIKMGPGSGEGKMPDVGVIDEPADVRSRILG